MLTPQPVQMTYTQYLTVGEVGRLASMAEYNIDTRIADDPGNVGIGFGLAVSQGTTHGDRSAVIGTVSGGNFIGLTVADPTLPNLKAPTLTDKFQDGDNMGVMTHGDMWVLPGETGVAVGLQVYFDDTTGELYHSSAGGRTLIKSAVWMTTPSTDPRAAGLAVVRLTKSPDPNS